MAKRANLNEAEGGCGCPRSGFSDLGLRLRCEPTIMTLSATCATGEVLLSPSYYRGEQYDSDLGLYYLRARYYNPLTGRFMSRDPDNHDVTNPNALHKYLYANGDPINALDPSGKGDEFLDYVGLAFTFAVIAPPIAAFGVCL